MSTVRAADLASLPAGTRVTRLTNVQAPNGRWSADYVTAAIVQVGHDPLFVVDNDSPVIVTWSDGRTENYQPTHRFVLPDPEETP